MWSPAPIYACKEVVSTEKCAKPNPIFGALVTTGETRTGTTDGLPFCNTQRNELKHKAASMIL